MNGRNYLQSAMLLTAVLFPVRSIADDLLFDNGNHVEASALAGTNSSEPDAHFADDFVLPSNSIVTGIQWKGYYGSFSPVDDDFKVLIYADDGSGKPTNPATDSAIYSQRAENGTGLILRRCFCFWNTL